MIVIFKNSYLSKGEKNYLLEICFKFYSFTETFHWFHCENRSCWMDLKLFDGFRV